MIGLSDVNNGMCCMTCYFLIINFCTDTRAARFDFHKVYVIYVYHYDPEYYVCVAILPICLIYGGLFGV